MAKERLSEATKKRLKAGRMLLAGKGCAETAMAVGVARQTVYTWKRVLDESGVDGLRAMVDVGRPSQLSAADFKWLDAALRRVVEGVVREEEVDRSLVPHHARLAVTRHRRSQRNSVSRPSIESSRRPMRRR